MLIGIWIFIKFRALYNFPNLTNCTIAVIGLGYVGLPLAAEFAKCKRSILNNQKLNRKIIGFDIDENRIRQLNERFDKTNEIDFKDIKETNNIIFTSDQNKLQKADVFIVTVPTPIDKTRKPELSFVKKACIIVANAMKASISRNIPIVIFESTFYPGTTEEVCLPILKLKSGLCTFSGSLSEKTFGLGYSPERINPGDKQHRISSIVKVTSGNTREISHLVNSLYGSIIKAGTYNTENIKVAEAAKVIENTQRDLNIALVNELSMIFEKLNIDTLDVLRAAQTKWNFSPYKPGLVGGHCIGVDPYYLTYKAEEVGYYPQVILAGRRINDNMAKWHIEQLVLDLAKRGMKINASKALILGLTFKENCPDIRNTKVVEMIYYLNNFNIKCDVIDPLADKEEVFREYKINTSKCINFNQKYSLIIVAVAHDYFLNFDLDKWQSLCEKDCLIFDLKGIVPRVLNPKRP